MDTENENEESPRNKIHWKQYEEISRPPCNIMQELRHAVKFSENIERVTCSNCLEIIKSSLRPATVDLDTLRYARAHCFFWLASRCGASCNYCVMHLRT